jgi:hypothetical protein
MKTPLPAITVALGLTAFMAGCQSTRATRIQENAALFATLDPFTQQVIQQGLFAHGFTPDLVYMSLGKPNNITTE